MKKYSITGMSCAACQNRIEKTVSNIDGVESCTVSLLTNSMTVEGTAESAIIINAVEKVGYGINEYGENNSETKISEYKKKENSIILRLFSSLFFLIILMYFSMGHSMLNFPVPKFLAENAVSMGLIQMLLSTVVIVINQKFFINGFKGIINSAANMDTLVAMGSGASYIYSLVLLFKISNAQATGNYSYAMELLHGLYFESAAMILVLVTVGKALESRSKEKTTDALKKLISLKPTKATIIRDGITKTVNASQVTVGDIFIVKPGETVPVDGVVISGNTVIDESALTGESIPAEKEEGSRVYCATKNASGYIECRAVSVGEDTTLSKIIQTVSDTVATKAPIARLADKVSGIFVPTVICISVITFIIWILAGKDIGFSLARAISVLVISCPCALGLATPVAITVGNGVAAKNGILFKTASVLESCGKISTVVLDKTGTITQGKPVVTDIIPFEGHDKSELMKFAYSLERLSEHPLANSITSYATEHNIDYYEVTDFSVSSGNGLKAVFENKPLLGGKSEFISQNNITIDKDFWQKATEISEAGKTPLYFSYGNSILGIIAVADTLKPDSAEAVKSLKDKGYTVVMLTGDNALTAKAIGSSVSVDKIVANVLPSEKAEEVKKLSALGKTAMIGDGINDAPALTAADVGIAIGAGSDIAIDAADVVLMKNSLKDAVFALSLGKATLKNIKENLFWAFFYNVICIPLAAGAFIPLLGWELNPMFGAAAMSLSSFCVVTNALRLNFFKTDNHKQKERKIKKMNVTLKIDGMMCKHCEEHVKNALEALNEVEKAEVDHTSGTAILTLNAEISKETLKSTVEKAGYKLI